MDCWWIRPKRVLSEIDAAAGSKTAGFRGLADLLRFGHSGDLSQQLQTVVSALDPLVRVDAIEVATVFCGALESNCAGLGRPVREGVGTLSHSPL